MSEETDKAILLCLRDIQQTLKLVENHLEYIAGAITIIEVNSTVSLTKDAIDKAQDILGEEEEDDDEEN